MAIRVHMLSLFLAKAYLLEGEAGLWLVDAGPPGVERRILRVMADLGRDDLRLIWISHAHLDHYGSAAALRAATGAPIAIHHAGAPAMAKGDTPIGSTRGRGRWIEPLLPWANRLLQVPPTEADVLLQEGDSLDDYGLSARLIHTPGHTAGSSSLLVAARLAFVGDLLSTTGRPHLQALFAQDWPQLPPSLHRLAAAQPERIYPGHGPGPLDRETLERLCVLNPQD
jgi:glyoxylase-like metal-dependent hydrolase (beta-lactamase superfamily II)